MNSLIVMVKNTSKGTFHPMYYLEYPFMNEGMNDLIVRYKSKGHHTTGFPTREEALENIRTQLKPILEKQGFAVILQLDNDMEWNGEDIPVDVITMSRA